MQYIYTLLDLNEPIEIFSSYNKPEKKSVLFLSQYIQAYGVQSKTPSSQMSIKNSEVEKKSHFTFLLSILPTHFKFKS